MNEIKTFINKGIKLIKIMEDTIDEIYFDQASTRTNFGGRSIFGAYTPHGIKCIESQYIALIQHMDEKVKEVCGIRRAPEIKISPRTGKEYESMDYIEYYEPVEMDKGTGMLGVRVEWRHGDVYSFYYGKRPKFGKTTHKTSPAQLIKDIQKNPHLHDTIKENLIGNIKSRIK